MDYVRGPMHHLLLLDRRTRAVDDSRCCDLVRSRCLDLVWGLVCISGLVVLVRVDFVGRSHAMVCISGLVVLAGVGPVLRSHATRRVSGRLVDRGRLHPVDSSGRVHDGLLPPPRRIVSRDCCAYRPRIAPPLQLLDPVVEPAKFPIHIPRTAVLEINYSLRDGAQERLFDCQDAEWHHKKTNKDKVQVSSPWRPSTPEVKRQLTGGGSEGEGQCELTMIREVWLKGRPPCQSLVAPFQGLLE